MKYDIFIIPRAQKELSQLSGDVYKSVCNAIHGLSDNPRPHGCIKLTGRDGWRIRVGNYRVIYEIEGNKKVVTIFHIGHRRDIYR